MLCDLESNEEFKQKFFVQVSANLEACEDRAAMSLNEIFTAWKIDILPPEASQREKLEILVGCAKTEALRNTLRKAIHEQEQKTGIVERENVEIFLYYEKHKRFKDKILTAIKTASYADQIGCRDWIDVEKLEEAINEDYFKAFMELPAYQKFLEEDDDYRNGRDAKLGKYHPMVEELLAQKDTLKDGEYRERSEEISKQRAFDELNFIKEWIVRKLGVRRLDAAFRCYRLDDS